MLRVSNLVIREKERGVCARERGAGGEGERMRERERERELFLSRLGLCRRMSK